MTTALFTDRYELTMLDAAVCSGIERRPVVFEAFTRSMPPHSVGVMVGTAAIADAVREFVFSEDDLHYLRSLEALSSETLDYLAAYRFGGSLRALAEGELFVAGTPLVRVDGTFGECVVLETVILSAINSGIAVANATLRARRAAGPDAGLIEMGSRRVNQFAAVDAARAAWIAGVDATSNLEAGRRYGVPTAGTAAHAWTLGNEHEVDAFVAQLRAAGPATTLLIDTYDVADGARAAIEAARRLGVDGPAAVRIDSGDLLTSSRAVRDILDGLGATATKIVASGELDADHIAALRLAGAPIDAYGLGTRLVLAPSPGCVYKLVERDGVPAAKRSTGKVDVGGAKAVYREWTATGAHDTVVIGHGPVENTGRERLDVPVFDHGELVTDADPRRAATAARERCADRRRRLTDGSLTASWVHTDEGGSDVTTGIADRRRPA